MDGMKARLSTLWVFAALNYVYCDVITLMDSSMLRGFLAGKVAGMNVSQGFLLAGGALIEIPIAMVFLSRVLGQRSGRWANIAAGATMTVVQIMSLATRTPAPHYVFFSIIEIACTSAIVWLAWKWTGDQRAPGPAREHSPSAAAR